MPLGTSWTDEEDERLRRLVGEHGPKRWSLIAQYMRTKGSKQCRRRWKNYLNADIKKGSWTPEEDRILIEGHKRFGNRWTEIAKLVGGRTDNAVKNRWAALVKRQHKSKQGRDGRCYSDSCGPAQDEGGCTPVRHHIGGSPAKLPGNAQFQHQHHVHRHSSSDTPPSFGGHWNGSRSRGDGSSHRDRHYTAHDRGNGTLRSQVRNDMHEGATASPRRQGLSLDVPCTPAEATTTDTVPTPVSLVVPQELLSPSELHYVSELNSMGIPLYLGMDSGGAGGGLEGGGLDHVVGFIRGDGVAGRTDQPTDMHDVLSALTPAARPHARSQCRGSCPDGLSQLLASAGLGLGPGSFHEGHRCLLRKIFLRARASLPKDSSAEAEPSRAEAAAASAAGPRSETDEDGEKPAPGGAFEEVPPIVELHSARSSEAARPGSVLMNLALSVHDIDLLLESLDDDGGCGANAAARARCSSDPLAPSPSDSPDGKRQKLAPVPEEPSRSLLLPAEADAAPPDATAAATEEVH